MITGRRWPEHRTGWPGDVVEYRLGQGRRTDRLSAMIDTETPINPAKETAVEQRDGTDFSMDGHLVEGVGVVVLHGEVDLAAAPEIREVLESAVQDGAGQVVVDLRDVSFIDSTALGALVHGRNRAVGRGGSVHLVTGSDAVTRILGLTGLDQVFPVHDSCDDALTAATHGSQPYRQDAPGNGPGS